VRDERGGAHDGQCGVGQQSTRGMKVGHEQAHGDRLVMPPGSIGDRLAGPGDGPMGPSP
jgi:hypothetical protein